MLLVSRVQVLDRRDQDRIPSRELTIREDLGSLVKNHRGLRCCGKKANPHLGRLKIMRLLTKDLSTKPRAGRQDLSCNSAMPASKGYCHGNIVVNLCNGRNGNVQGRIRVVTQLANSSSGPINAKQSRSRGGAELSGYRRATHPGLLDNP